MAKNKKRPKRRVSSRGSSRRRESQDGVHEMCGAIAAFKPACDEFARRLITELQECGHITESQMDGVQAYASGFMQEMLPELVDEARTTPA